MTWPRRKDILRSGTEFSLGSSLARPTWERVKPEVTSWQPEVTSSQTGSDRKSTTDHVVLTKNNFIQRSGLLCGLVCGLSGGVGGFGGKSMV